MDGRDFVKSLPADPCPAREDKILDAVLDGHIAKLVWHTITIQAKGHEAKIEVSDALQLGEDNSVRLNCTHPTAQRIADAIDQTEPKGAVLPTAKLVDDSWASATLRLPPCTQPSDPAERKATGYSPSMSDTGAMLRHHDDVEHALLKARQPGMPPVLAAPEGKNWVCSNRINGHPELAANYGLQAKDALYRAVTQRGGMVWQPGPGTAHTVGHTDYSQIVMLVRRIITVDGAERDIEDVARDPELCWLVSTEGTMQALRHPGVPRPGHSAQPADSEPTPVTTPAPKPIFTRTIRRGSLGIDVSAWQSIIGVKADGIFGAKTEATTKAWQQSHGLKADGIVGPATRRAALDKVAPESVATPPGHTLAELSPLKYATILSANFTKAFRTTVHWLVLHVMQAPEKPSTAEAVANWAAGKSGEPPRVSWHWAYDNDSSVLCVPEEHVAWHASKANRFGIGYEHAGYCDQTRAEWLDDYSAAMLWLSAQAAAKITGPRWNLPLDNVVDAAGLKRAYAEFIDRGLPVPNELRGITTHHAVTIGLGGTHTDPDPNWPMDVYLDWVKKAA